MFRLLFFVLFLASVHGAQNICKTGVFEFEGTQVNGYQTIDVNITLSEVGTFLLQEDLKFDRFSTEQPSTT